MSCMIRRLILKKLDAEEKRLGASLDYLRHILRVSLRAFLKLLRFVPLGTYRRRLPLDAFHVARLVATRAADCGTCVQIEVNLARQDGVPVAVLRAVVEGRPEALPPELVDVFRFADAVIRSTGDAEDLRPRLRERLGEEALIELAYAIASSAILPLIKRALGYGTSCALVKIEGLG